MRHLGHVCVIPEFKAGDPRPAGYLEWHEWARVQGRAGIKTKRCRKCKRYYFPQEKHTCRS